MADKVDDQTTKTIDTETSTTTDGDLDDKPTEGAEEKEKPESTTESDNFVAGILDEYNLDTPEDLKDFLGNLVGLQDRIGDADLDELKDNSKTLQKYQAAWQKAEGEKLKEGETPEETISRLEKEKKEIQQKRTQDHQDMQSIQESQKMLKGFADTVQSSIRADKTVPEEYRPYLAEFLGVDNPVNDIDIEDKATVRKTAKNAIKKMKAFEQTIIARYKAGKTAVPKTPPATVTTPEGAPGDPTKSPKNLKEARKRFHELAQKLGSG